MKKFILWVLTVVLCLSFAACSGNQAKEVDSLILEIGEVALDSGSAIETARDAYEELSEKGQSKVTELATLEQAEKTFEVLYEDIDNTEELIADIGVVDIDSADQIHAARTAYEELSGIEQKYVENYDLLCQAEDEFDALGIRLTLDNYETYLDVSYWVNYVQPEDYGIMMGVGREINSDVYYGVEPTVVVEGKSDNYNYHDVVVTVEYKALYIPMNAEVVKKINKGETTVEQHGLENNCTIEDTITVNADIVGDGLGYHSIDIVDNCWVFEDAFEVNFEVISVSGLLTD